MKTMIIAAVAAIGLASPGVVAQAPAGNDPSIDTAQQTGSTGNRSSHSRWLSPPVFTVPGMARR